LAIRGSLAKVLLFLSLSLHLQSANAGDRVTDLFETEEEIPIPAQQKLWRPDQMGVPPPAVSDVVHLTQGEPLASRLDQISSALIGQTYSIDPLGEGRPPDLDPRARYDQFDCLTYVEEVLALASSDSVHMAASSRNALRYSGPLPNYATRNHFMELQWVPNAIRGGWVRDISSRFTGSVSRSRKIDAHTWKQWGPSRDFHMSVDRFPTGTMRLAFVPIDDMLLQIDQIPSGSILMVVRDDRADKPLWISHIGFVFQGKRPIIRHATKLGGGSVRENGLQWYLNHLKTYKHWRASGVVILQPTAFGPRLSRLDQR
jgi:hypothetical protein